MLEHKYYRESLLIRRVEETLLALFSKGKLNGTVHTCVGQEFSAVAFGNHLEKDDVVFSNHRCHGHYISFTKDWQGLVAELMGKGSGTCGGIGSSQHLCRDNFFSNGIQGGIVPVSAGMALANKLDKSNNIGVVFIGDGTLGEGVVYEVMNLISLLEIPLLIVCENNLYAQSTPQTKNLSGNILKRAEAFGVQSTHSNTWDTEELFAEAQSSIDSVRKMKKPVFHLVDTYRLNPHSKGDDDRSPDEISKYREIDPLNIFARENSATISEWLTEINEEIDKVVSAADSEAELSAESYISVTQPQIDCEWRPAASIEKRQIERLNHFFDSCMDEDSDVLFIGEDVHSPYGGAFKAAKNLSDKYPQQVITTPISEAAITGLSNGLALAGKRPFLEIMFGDFVTLCMDQIINHASKFYHMYNKQIECPVVIRTPMGGHRGYGPTHSQTLDKLLIGIDNVKTVALNTLVDPVEVYREIYSQERHPVIVIENKCDYPKKKVLRDLPGFIVEQSSHRYPIVRIRPARSNADLTLVTYGGMVEFALESMMSIFTELDLKPEVYVLSQLHPLDMQPVIEAVQNSGRLFVVEEGSAFSGFGSEVIAAVAERASQPFVARRVAAHPVPIPSCGSLESYVLPNTESILDEIRRAV